MFVETEVPRTRRQWQRDRAILALEEAALRVFERDGYDNATAVAIAAEAGVSMRTFFRYFPQGKEEVMLVEARRTSSRIRDAIRTRPLDEPLGVAVRRAILGVSRQQSPELLGAGRAYALIARDQPKLLASMIGEGQLRAEQMAEVLALRLGVDPQADPRPRLLAHVLYAALNAAWLSWLHSDDADLAPLFEQHLDLLEPLFDAAVADSVA